MGYDEDKPDTINLDDVVFETYDRKQMFYKEGYEDAKKEADAQTIELEKELKEYIQLFDEAHDMFKKANHLLIALEKLSEGRLYWPSSRQPDPRTIAYESRTLKEIEEMAKNALLEYRKEIISNVQNLL